MRYHVIHLVKLQHINIDRLPEIYFAMSFLCLLLATLCGVYLIRRIR